MNSLNFIDTQTVEQFKEEKHVKEICVYPNPKTNKQFMTYGGRTGAVRAEGVPEHPMISLVNASLDREPTKEEMAHIGKSVRINGQNVADPKANGFFYLLHEEAMSNLTPVATF